MPAQTPVSVGTARYTQFDTAPDLVRTLFEGDGVTPIDLTGATVTIKIAFQRYSHFYSPRVPIIPFGPCAIVGAPADGVVSWTPLPTDLSPPGQFHFSFRITFAGGAVQTVPSHTYETLVILTPPGGRLP